MAPVDRHERRQQRMRGAGASSVLENFGFSFAPAQKNPPVHRAVTPQLGKRKRGSTTVQASADDGEPDDLSPERDDEMHSVEKSRRVVDTVSPMREDMDDEPDELSILQHSEKVLQGTVQGTPRKTPIADSIGAMAVRSTVDFSRRPKSAEPQPVTPSLLPTGHPRLSSASHFGPEFTTPGAPQDGEGSEDELSPPMNPSVTRVVAQEQPTLSATESVAEEEVDELSSPPQPASVEKSQPLPSAKKAKQAPKQRNQPARPSPEPVPAKERKSRRIVVDEEDQVQATPAARKPRRRPTSLDTPEEVEIGEDSPDEISPEADRVRRRPQKAVHDENEAVNLSSAEESNDYEPAIEEGSRTRDRQPALKQKPASGEPFRKRQKFGGPKQAISVMRIKGSTVRGITVADMTRTILEQNIDHRASRMAEKLQNAQDSSRRRQIRVDINLALAFKESLDEKLLDLQDANDTLNAGFQKRRILKNTNIERRKDILALQNSRQEIALEADDEQAVFDAEKEKAEAKNKLNANMFEIQAAIQSGRERARQQGREDEGPEIPLRMLLETVGRDVGSVGGGLLARMREFNGGLERTAEWLEGRA